MLFLLARILPIAAAFTSFTRGEPSRSTQAAPTDVIMHFPLKWNHYIERPFLPPSTSRSLERQQNGKRKWGVHIFALYSAPRAFPFPIQTPPPPSSREGMTMGGRWKCGDGAGCSREVVAALSLSILIIAERLLNGTVFAGRDSRGETEWKREKPRLSFAMTIAVRSSGFELDWYKCSFASLIYMVKLYVTYVSQVFRFNNNWLLFNPIKKRMLLARVIRAL